MSVNQRPVIGLIPARGGSKGIERKNIKNILNKPLLVHTVEAALESQYVDFTYLSSDDDEILSCAEAIGAKPILRPSEFATDSASAVDVVLHFFKEIPKQLIEQDPYIIYLQPTSPLRTSLHIDLAFEKMETLAAHSLISVMEMTKSPYKSFSINVDGRMQSIFNEKFSNARRQDLPKTYLPNGAIYIFRKSDFLNNEGFPSNGSVPFLMSQADSIDIDTEEDIRYLEYIIGKKNG